MFVLVSAVLAAAPIHLIAVHGPQSADALSRLNALPNVTTLDASALHEYLLRTEGLMPMQDFDGFTAAPVKEWPAASADIWNKGLAHCLKLVGPPPWGSNMGSALACANRLSVYLWQQYAALQKAARVFEVDVSVDERRGNARVRGSVWEPNSRDQLFLDEGGKLANLPKTMDLVLSALIQKKGATQARNVVGELESAGLGDPFSGSAKVTTPVTFPKTCAKLPASITVTPPGAIADSLMARWTPAGATGPVADCKLTFSEHTESTAMGPMAIVTTLLTCSSTIVASELAKTAAARAPVDVISERLVQGLATKLCH